MRVGCLTETITYKPGYWTFDCFAKSDEALNLVSNLFSSLKLNKGKKNKLSDKQLEARHVAFDRCLSTLIVKTELEAGIQVYHSLGKSSFNASGDGSSTLTFGVSHNNFRLIVDALVAKGYLEHTPGKKYAEEDFNNPDGSPTPLAWSFVASHFAPTLKLIKLIRKYGLTKKTLTTYHFGKDKPKVFLQVSYPNQSNGRNKLRGRKVDNNLISSDSVYQAELADMQFINEQLHQHQLEGGEFSGLKRIFNNYTDEGYIWDAGGRMYGVEQDGYQKLASSKRAKMTINGEPVVEIDIEACFLTILFGLMNKPMPNQDMYEVDGMPRPIVKSWMTIALTNGKLPTKWPSKAKEELEKKLPGVKMPTAPKVAKAVLKRYKWLEGMSDSDIGWPKLQYIESIVMKNTVMELLGEGIPAYPVHDSVIVPASARVQAIDVLQRQFEIEVSVRPRID
jgi:hypothetical protein